MPGRAACTVPLGPRRRRKGRGEKGRRPGPREGPGSRPPPTWRVLSARRPGRGHGPYLLVIPAATPSISPKWATVPRHLGSRRCSSRMLRPRHCGRVRAGGRAASRKKRRTRGRKDDADAAAAAASRQDPANGGTGHAGARAARGPGEVGAGAVPAMLETRLLAFGPAPGLSGPAPPPAGPASSSNSVGLV